MALSLLVRRAVPVIVLITACSSLPRSSERGCAVATRECVQDGYALQPRRSSSGSSGSYIVDARDLAGVSRVEQLIDGRFPGVVVERMGGEYQIHIRGGASSLHGGEPLIVIDGIPAPYGLTSHTILGSLSPSMVARIDVLKDAASAGAYGSRAGNGVIVITMRR